LVSSQLHEHAAVIGTLLSASYSLTQFVFAPIWGRLSDRVGRRPIILLSLVGVGLSYILFGLSSGHLWMLFAARLLSGILSSASIGVAFAYIADITPPEKRAGRIGLLGACIGMGFVFGPFLGGVLGSISLPLPAFVAAGMALLNFGFTLRSLPESLSAEERARQLTAAHNDSPIALMTKVVSGPAGFLFLLTFITTFGFAAMEQIFSYYLLASFPNQVTPLNQPRMTGYILGIAGVISGIIQGGLIGRLSKRFGEGVLVRTGLTFMVIGFALFPLPRSVWGLAFGPMILLFSGRSLITPGLSSLISRKANLGQGLTLSTSQSFDSLARAFGPILAGAAFGYVGHAAPYYISAVVMAIALSLAFAKRREMTLPTAAVLDAAVGREVEIDESLTEAH
jgi:multidrug resistance protein